jgi:RND family efflux transporter MFP subunit
MARFRGMGGRRLTAALAVALLLACRDAGRSASSGAQASPPPAERVPVAIDARRQQIGGIVLEDAVRGTLASAVPAAGVLEYDRTRLTDVSMRIAGWVQEVYVHASGEPVNAGQKLLSLYSYELESLQAQLIGALRNRDLVPAETAQPQPQYAERLVDTPRERLLRANVPEDQLRVIEEKRQILPALLFRSPVSGVVIESNVVRGMHVDEGETLYRLADLSVLWLEADVPEADLSALQIGASAQATVAAWPGERFGGRVIAISPALRESGRNVSVRIELANAEGRLKPGMPARVEIAAPERAGVLVAEDALVETGTQRVVFIARPDGYFEPREVTPGARAGGRVLIAQGLAEGERVVRRGAFLVDSESRLQAALQDYAAVPPGPAVAATADALDIRVRVQPDPPQAGRNAVEVEIRDQSGAPVTDLDVSMLLSMPAMPSMNMPAMRSDAQLEHVRDGVYAGEASLSMAGRWDVAVTAARAGHAIATARTAFNAR